VPTIAESGFPQYEVNGWNGLLAPAGAPGAIVNRIQSELAKALKQTEVRDRMASSGLDAVGSTPAQFSALIKVEISKWAKVIQQSGATAE
jgi:tripartite-type tricarboxylate transporter receptor subunit TctC